MIKFRQINDNNPALACSPMVRALEKTFAYIAEHGSIELTPSKAFKRKFVHWAAREFDWPGYTEADLFAINKVLNEIDFRPLMDLHDLMIALKIGRHYKGAFKLTKQGQSLVDKPGQIFGIVTPFYLFEVDHMRFSQINTEPVPGNWDVFLNVLNVEAENGATGARIRRVLFGEPASSTNIYMMNYFYVQVLRPLCRTGLLDQQAGTDRFSMEDEKFTKTPLWKAALELGTDAMVRQSAQD